MSGLDHQHTIERNGLRDIVGNAEHGCGFPMGACVGQQGMALLSLQASEWFIHHDEPDGLFEHGSSQAHALTFSAGNDRTAFPQIRLQALGQRRQQFQEVGLLNQRRVGQTGGGPVA